MSPAVGLQSRVVAFAGDHVPMRDSATDEANCSPRRASSLQRSNGPDFLVLCTTRDLSHIPKQVAITVRTAMVEGSKVSRGVLVDTGIAIPSAQNPIPNAQICSIFIRRWLTGLLVSSSAAV